MAKPSPKRRPKRCGGEVPVKPIDHYRISKCDKCGIEVKEVYTLIDFFGKTVCWKQVLCEACYQEHKGRGLQ
jgi:hypothetical protein